MFLDENDFRKNYYYYYFFSCLVVFRKIFYSVIRKIEKKGRGGARRGGGGEAFVFKKWFMKKLSVNHFPNFNKGFSGQRKLFSV
jgi:hypothetical protein